MQMKQIRNQFELLVEQFCLSSAFKALDIVAFQCILRVSITEVHSGLMQLVTTSCFSNSESSHSLAIISWSVCFMCVSASICVLRVNANWRGLHVCNEQSQFLSAQCGAPSEVQTLPV